MKRKITEKQIQILKINWLAGKSKKECAHAAGLDPSNASQWINRLFDIQPKARTKHAATEKPCKTCQYYCNEHKCCQYILITQKIRPKSDKKNECLVYEKGEPIREPSVTSVKLSRKKFENALYSTELLEETIL